MLSCATAQVNIADNLPALFEPSAELMQWSGLQLDDALLQPDDKGRVYLLAHSSSSMSQKLKSNILLGHVDKYASEQQPEEFPHVGIAADSPEGNGPAMARGPWCQYSCWVLKARPENAADDGKRA